MRVVTPWLGLKWHSGRGNGFTAGWHMTCDLWHVTCDNVTWWRFFTITSLSSSHCVPLMLHENSQNQHRNLIKFFESIIFSTKYSICSGSTVLITINTVGFCHHEISVQSKVTTGLVLREFVIDFSSQHVIYSSQVWSGAVSLWDSDLSQDDIWSEVVGVSISYSQLWW